MLISDVPRIPKGSYVTYTPTKFSRNGADCQDKHIASQGDSRNLSNSAFPMWSVHKVMWLPTESWKSAWTWKLCAASKVPVFALMYQPPWTLQKCNLISTSGLNRETKNPFCSKYYPRANEANPWFPQRTQFNQVCANRFLDSGILWLQMFAGKVT